MAEVAEVVVLPTKEELAAGEQVQETPELTAEETKAYEKGWRPEAEFEGEGWIDAKEFNGRAPLYEGLSKASKRIKALEGVVKTLADQTKKADSIALEKAKEQLKRERVKAHKDEDYEKVIELEDKSKELDAQGTEQAQQLNQEEFAEWRDENTWYVYEGDKPANDATVFADAYGQRLVSEGFDGTNAELFAKVGEHVKKVMPQEFEEPSKKLPNRGAPPGSQGGGRKPTGPNYGMLNQDQKAVCRELVNTGIITREDYIKQLDEMGELDKG